MDDLLYNCLLIGLRTILAFVVLFLLARIMGIRQISQLTFYDYITGITIGSVAAQMAVDDSIPLLYFLVALILFALLTLGISIVTTKNIRARKFLSGTPSVLV